MESIEQPKPTMPTREEIEKNLKENIIKIFNQVQKGCSRPKCYNIYCAKNIFCQERKLIIYNIL